MSAEVKLPMYTADIEKYVPHRYPFLLVDRIIEFEPEKRIVGIKNVSITEPVLQGHFPGNPIMPGVLQVEAIAQVSTVLGRHAVPECKDVLLTEVTETRFRRRVIPGDTMRLEVRVVKQRKPFFWFEGEVSVDGESAATVKFSAKLL